MGISLLLATGLLDAGLAMAVPALAPPSHPQDGTLLQRGYELLPDARWRQEILRDETFRIGNDAWVTDRLYPNHAWVPDVSKPELDLLLAVERFTARDLLVYRPVRLVMPHRPDDSGIFDRKHPAWEKVVGSVFYGAAFVDALSEAIHGAITGALGSGRFLN